MEGKKVHDVSGLDVAESDSEDEWNYFKGDEANKGKTNLKVNLQPDNLVAESLEEDNMSQLNPNAAEFVPVSPTRSIPSPACRNLINDQIIAQSPSRPGQKVLDANIPDAFDFDKEIKSRPSELESYENGHKEENETMKNLELMENLLNGKKIEEIPEFQPGSTPTKQSLNEEFHFGPNATPFTPSKLLDQSEAALSTRAVFGDESVATLGASFNESISQDNTTSMLLNKESDPMSMSFYDGKEGENPFDLNDVQVLPDNIDEFLENDQPNVKAAINNDDGIQTTDLDKTAEDGDKNHDDEKELASPMSPDDLFPNEVCQLPQTPEPTKEHDEPSSDNNLVNVEENINLPSNDLPELSSPVCDRPESKSPLLDVVDNNATLLDMHEMKSPICDISENKSPICEPEQAISPEPSITSVVEISESEAIPETKPITPEPEALAHEFAPHDTQSPVLSPEPQEKSEPLALSPEPQALSPEPQALSPEPQALSPEPQALSPEPQVLSPEPQVLSTEPQVLSPEPQALSPEPQVLSPEPQTMSSEPQALSPEPQALSPEPQALSPEPQALSSEPQDLAPEAQTLSPEPQALSPEPQVLSHESQPLSPEPEVLSPEPQALSPEAQALSPEPQALSPEPQALSPEPQLSFNQTPLSPESEFKPFTESATPEPHPLSPEVEILSPEHDSALSSPMEEEKHDICKLESEKAIESPHEDITSSVKDDVSSPTSPQHIEERPQDLQLPPEASPDAFAQDQQKSNQDELTTIMEPRTLDLETTGEPFVVKTENIAPEFAEPTVVTPSETSEIGTSVPLVETPEVEPVVSVPTLEEKKEQPKEDKPSSADKKSPAAKIKSTTAGAAKKAPLKSSTTTTTAKPSAAKAPAAAKTLTANRVAAKPSTTSKPAVKSTSATTATKPPTTKPATAPLAARKPLTKPADKKPLTNGDVKAAPVKSTPLVKKTVSDSTTKPSRPSLTASSRTVPPKTTLSPRPATAPRTITKTTTSSPKPAATAASKVGSNTSVKATSKTTLTSKTSATSPKTASAPKPKPPVSSTLTKPRVPLSKSAVKAPDAEKQNKESANKLTASRVTTSTTRATGPNASKTTTRRVELTKNIGSRTTVTKTTTTTTATKSASPKKPAEITRSVSKTKTTKVEKPKENGISAVVTEEITIVNNVINDIHQLVKDNSPIDNKLIVENPIIDANTAD